MNAKYVQISLTIFKKVLELVKPTLKFKLTLKTRIPIESQEHLCKIPLQKCNHRCIKENLQLYRILAKPLSYNESY